MTITCTRRIQFCAGHRVMGHENKCARLHGHNYVALVDCAAGGLDAIGRVIDFSVVKERIGGFIEREWDHRFLMFDQDQLWQLLPQEFGLVLVPFNPTAENIADHLLRVVAPRVLDGTDVQCVAVRVWETENCYADARL